MASTISAGTSAGTAIAITGDTSGALSLLTNNGTTAVTITTAQNVGIGTTAPNDTLEVAGANAFIRVNRTAAEPGITFRYSNSSTNRGDIAVTSAGAMYFTAGGSTERMRIDSSGNFLFNSGYGSVATAYGCRAWVNFNGTGTVAIRGSGNVSSITDNGTGDYTVNFTTAMPDINYTTVASISTNAGTAGIVAINSDSAGNTAPTTSATRLSIYRRSDGALLDSPYVNLSIFR